MHPTPSEMLATQVNEGGVSGFLCSYYVCFISYLKQHSNQPGFIANKSFDVKVHGDILGRKDWNLQR